MIEDLLRPQHLVLILGIILLFSVALVVAGSAAALAFGLLRRIMPRERSR
ncbi:MAG TPA: hypothetical protein VGE89_13515 [Bryobacteraceae bacterium]|jgi:hypothetical protein